MWSCNEWLNVHPREHTAEEMLFSREVGFKEALIGAYQLAARQGLYGERLTFGFLDQLAQRYLWINARQETPFQDPAFYDFRTDASQGQINAIWRDMYRVIANLNNLLGWLDRNGSVIATPGMYEIIRGEALALRSFLYFDLLRMFGPIFKEDPTAPSIVFRTELNRDFRGLETAEDMVNYIIRDLNIARELLHGNDPLNFALFNPGGTPKMGATPDEDPFLIFRFKRMNELAVKALLARVYLYKGDHANARAYAQKVRNSGHFSLARTNLNNAILASEIIFALHIHRIEDNVTSRIDANSSFVINDRDNFFSRLFNIEQDGENDFRVRLGAGFEVTHSVVFTMNKFNQTGLPHGVRGAMPLIRLAEMYYILSEAAETLEEATFWLNQVREARGILPLPVFSNVEEKMRAITIEYRKEFFGEGQMWFFYKRIGADVDTFFNMENILPELTSRHFVFPVPDDEFLFGGIPKPVE